MSSISCYQCSSINGSNPACEDFFHGELEGVPAMLQTPCLTSSRGRQGRFLATHCIKLVAYSSGRCVCLLDLQKKRLLSFSIEPNPVQYVYRTCSRDEGDDDSITRMSHCGFLKLHWINPNRRLRGCLHVCDKDACNQSSLRSISIWPIIFSFIVLFVSKRIVLK